eukprot:TRINITY_DN20565_c0_g1_i1.p1 TRINITY_DN20565_c0_g1~~TRINITY_DN20565_c0_g1_i1.p1  ORF type:complete len:517 (+),score=91.16 TRINITY_DN20565_c0_g1_i1:96-1553(+)
MAQSIEQVTHCLTLGETQHMEQAEDVSELRPTKLFVGGISRRTTTKQLREHFSKGGRVLDCVAMRQPDGRPRGFGYVTMECPDVAAEYLRTPQTIDDRVVDVKPAVPDTAAGVKEKEKAAKTPQGPAQISPNAATSCATPAEPKPKGKQVAAASAAVPAGIMKSKAAAALEANQRAQPKPVNMTWPGSTGFSRDLPQTPSGFGLTASSPALPWSMQASPAWQWPLSTTPNMLAGRSPEKFRAAEETRTGGVSPEYIQLASSIPSVQDEGQLTSPRAHKMEPARIEPVSPPPPTVLSPMSAATSPSSPATPQNAGPAGGLKKLPTPSRHRIRKNQREEASVSPPKTMAEVPRAPALALAAAIPAPDSNDEDLLSTTFKSSSDGGFGDDLASAALTMAPPPGLPSPTSTSLLTRFGSTTPSWTANLRNFPDAIPGSPVLATKPSMSPVLATSAWATPMRVETAEMATQTDDLCARCVRCGCGLTHGL